MQNFGVVERKIEELKVVSLIKSDMGKVISLILMENPKTSH